MRTLTQVWVFFITLTFLFLLLGFQLAGRLGLFIAFLISLLLVYATLHRGIRLFKRKLNVQEFSGNDASGFLNEIQNNKLKFGFRKINVYKTLHPTPPLIWRSGSSEGHLILNSNLIDNLGEVEIKLLSIFLLSHLQKRSFLIAPILSVINQSFFNFNILSFLLSHVAHFFFKTRKDVLSADIKFRNTIDYSQFEAGYFVNKLHQFEFHQTTQQLGTEYFSVLSVKKQGLYGHYGIPDLNLRLQQIMGFYI
jgi:hypothetical protein